MDGSGGFQDDDEVHIVVDLSSEPLIPSFNDNGCARTRYYGEASRSYKRKLQQFDLNGPAQQEAEQEAEKEEVQEAEQEAVQEVAVEYPASSIEVVMDFTPIDGNSVEDYSGSNFEATFDGYIDWGRGSIDIAHDGSLTYTEDGPTTMLDDHRGVDLNTTVEEAQSLDDARRENLRLTTATYEHVHEENDVLYFIEDDLWFH